MALTPVIDESAGDPQVEIDVQLLALQFALAADRTVHCICDLPTRLSIIGPVTHFTCQRFHRYPDDRRTVRLPFLFRAVGGLLELVEPGREGELVAPPYQLQLCCASPCPPAASPSPSYVETHRRPHGNPAPVAADVPGEPVADNVPAEPVADDVPAEPVANDPPAVGPVVGVLDPDDVWLLDDAALGVLVDELIAAHAAAPAVLPEGPQADGAELGD